MKTSRFTESQIRAILKEADTGVPVNEMWRKHGIGSATDYTWKAKYGGLDASELARVQELESENSPLKRMYAALVLESEAIKAVLKNCSAVRTAECGRPAGKRGTIRAASLPSGRHVAGGALPQTPRSRCVTHWW